MVYFVDRVLNHWVFYCLGTVELGTVVLGYCDLEYCFGWVLWIWGIVVMLYWWFTYELKLLKTLINIYLPLIRYLFDSYSAQYFINHYDVSFTSFMIVLT